MEKIFLWKDEAVITKAGRPSIHPMLLGKKAPAILIIPGGGYSTVCETTEGSPIGRKFNELGYHAFILDYRTAPLAYYPAPQLDAMRAMKMIRSNAEKWQVDQDRVYVCGFSAGGHLAGSLGTICNALDASNGDECDSFSHIPTGMILCYGVLAFEEWSHAGSMKNLLGDKFEEHRTEYSLPDRVDGTTPPAFMFHTVRDQVVDYRNSIRFAEAMAKAGRPCQLALTCWGDHGMLLAKNTLDGESWPEQADRFFRSVILSENDPGFRERYTNKYQAALVQTVSAE